MIFNKSIIVGRMFGRIKRITHSFQKHLILKRTLLVVILLILFSSLMFSQSSKTYVALRNGVKIYGKVEIHTPFFARSYVTVGQSVKDSDLVGAIGTYGIPSNMPTHVHIAVWRPLPSDLMDLFNLVEIGYEKYY